jgi:hypothetical protein
MITAETIRFVEHIHKKYTRALVDDMLSIWHKLQKTPLDTSDITNDLPRNACTIEVIGEFEKTCITTEAIGELLEKTDLTK